VNESVVAASEHDLATVIEKRDGVHVIIMNTCTEISFGISCFNAKNCDTCSPLQSAIKHSRCMSYSTMPARFVPATTLVPGR
jgi:hypothetical protein